jgi:hypothetical protein
MPSDKLNIVTHQAALAYNDGTIAKMTKNWLPDTVATALEHFGKPMGGVIISHTEPVDLNAIWVNPDGADLASSKLAPANASINLTGVAGGANWIANPTEAQWAAWMQRRLGSGGGGGLKLLAKTFGSALWGRMSTGAQETTYNTLHTLTTPISINGPMRATSPLGQAIDRYDGIQQLYAPTTPPISSPVKVLVGAEAQLTKFARYYSNAEFVLSQQEINITFSTPAADTNYVVRGVDRMLRVGGGFNALGGAGVGFFFHAGTSTWRASGIDSSGSAWQIVIPASFISNKTVNGFTMDVYTQDDYSPNFEVWSS